MDVWTIIPVKSLVQSKQRLAHLLPPEARAALMGDLLTHVLSIVKETPRITRLLVISDDPQVWEIAQPYGAVVLPESEPSGLNNAVSEAYAYASQHGAQAVLILPADLPFVQTADLTLMIDAVLTQGEINGALPALALDSFATSDPVPEPARAIMAICPDRRGAGTNGLLLRPPHPFQFAYGPDSFQKHIQEALDHGYELRLVSACGLQFDLDTEADWQRLSADERGALLTRSAM